MKTSRQQLAALLAVGLANSIFAQTNFEGQTATTITDIAPGETGGERRNTSARLHC
jgi:hypothetical protein